MNLPDNSEVLTSLNKESNMLQMLITACEDHEKVPTRFIVTADTGSKLLSAEEFSSQQMIYVVTFKDNHFHISISSGPSMDGRRFDDFKIAAEVASKLKASNGHGPIKFYVVTELQFLQHRLEQALDNIALFEIIVQKEQIKNNG